MVSIACVIPTHNRPDGLRRALRSVLEQSFKPNEIIVVDDLAQPETAAVVAALSEGGNITLLQPAFAEGHRSAGSSRNHGAENASSDYLAFLDDDDRWHPSFLSKLVDELQDSDESLACCWIGVESEGQVLRVRRTVPHMKAQEVLTRNPGFTGSNFMISREAFASIGGFDSELPVSNDIDFLVRALQAGFDYMIVPMVLAYQNVGGRGHLSSRGPSRAQGILKYQEKYSHMLSPQDLRRLRRKRYVAMRFPEQKIWWRCIYFFLTVLTSDKEAWVAKLKSVVNRHPAEYA